ncbi:hypothetical protein BDY21DRAFT_388542 [Lineolata rhizophorae]|uniref:Aminoglycoside phosphotransferase domain-containing protein n=1 Tax=Lineolata rhizophorae TaxID=578093 RepID=A0A6A6NLJ5_9PEZI|nr:hypothetical protein BDY21DRAFT_388542 [Lineolata rhizophorae]
MPPAFELLDHGPSTYEAAVEIEDNVISQLTYVSKTKNSDKYFRKQRSAIEGLTAHHLGLDGNSDCIVLSQHAWIRGTFNVCIPVEVKSGGASRKTITRCPIPHKLAEAEYIGTKNCHDIPTSHLFGFGFSGGRHFIHKTHRPFYVRFTHTVWRHLYALLRYPVLSQYSRSPIAHHLRTGYMIVEFIEPSRGQMLSKTRDENREEPSRKGDLFRGMARLIISRVPQPRIGSFRFHADGTIAPINRPLSCSNMILENDGAPRVLQRSDTYTCTDAFISDLFTSHNNRFLGQPNAVYDERDCRGQMAVKMLLRALSHHYLKQELREGPFILQLTDFHASNIFVNQEWNISCLIDLEWICCLPVEMLTVPYWLTGRGIDQIKEKHFHEFNKGREDAMWESKGVWLWHCLESVNAMYFLLESHLYLRFSSTLSLNAEEIVSQFRCENSEDVVAKKFAEKEQYDRDLRSLFDERGAAKASEE